MRDLAEMSVIHIDVTNACHLRCANCTRHLGHHKKPFFMDLEFIAKAIDSLEGFSGRIGLMGGEPMMHPKIKEIIELFAKKTDRRHRHIWTAGYKWEEYKDLVQKHYDEDLITFNDHTAPGKHQPLLVAIDDVVENKELADELISNCWVQEQWSASITPKGGFFCEVAGSLDYLLDGPGGVEIEKGWWKKSLNHFQKQINSNCRRCSACIPLQTESDGFGGRNGPTIDTLSVSNLELLKDKSNEAGCLDYLGNRTAILNKTEELIKGSEFVVCTTSTALAFAIIYKKPIFFIYSNETKRNILTLNAINTLSNYFKTKSINIDESVSESQVKSLINFDEKLYENYKADFLASNSKSKNYQIILEYLNK